MQGDFDRMTFQRSKHYRLVMRQQGRVDVAADWNEQQRILRHYGETEAMDVIGQSGVPQPIPPAPGGFKVGVAAAGNDLTLTAGRIYVDGILCENEADSSLLAQPDLPAVPVPAALAAWSIGGTPLPPADGSYIAYLQVWLRHISALDDAFIRESALGGPDTATRAKIVWQLKLQPGNSCAGFVPPAAPAGTMAARTGPVADGGPCVIPPTAGYRRLQNQLYRIEIHRGGAGFNSVTFKWSRDNGTVVTRILGGGGTKTLTVRDIGPDDYLGFHAGDWVEIVDDVSELNRASGRLYRIASPPVDQNTIELDLAASGGVAPVIDLVKNPKLRRWDQVAVPGGPDLSNGVPIAPVTADGWIPLEDGLQVRFIDGASYRTGDYWHVAARTAIDGDTGNLNWPPDANPRAPQGIRDHYCPLAVVTALNGRFVAEPPPTDCRKLFPPLTALNTDCQCCAVTLDPKKDWQAVLQKLLDEANGQRIIDASICFQVGDFVVTRPIKLNGRGNLKITGGGPGTRILAPRFETALEFSGYASVAVSDLHAETGRTGIFGDGMKNLGGVLTFRDCQSVHVHRVTLRGADGIRKAASAILVENQPPAAARGVAAGAAAPAATLSTSVRIHHCDIEVGQYQVGILVVNAARVQIEDNRIGMHPAARPVKFTRLMENVRLRGEYRRLIVHEQAQSAGPKARNKHAWLRKPLIPVDELQLTLAAGEGKRLTLGYQPVKITANNRQGVEETFTFQTPEPLVRPWQELFKGTRRGGRRTLTLRGEVQKLADRLLADAAFRKNQAIGDRARNSPWIEFWRLLMSAASAAPAVGAQGIVVGGSFATDVRIRDNSIAACAEAIHVGLSHRGAGRGDAGQSDSAANVAIRGNSIDLLVPIAIRQRGGIFVGNCDNLIIEDNLIVSSQRRAAEMGIDGICVFGFLGRLMLVRQNRLRRLPGGIYVQPLNAAPAPAPAQPNAPTTRWLVGDNLIEGGGVRREGPGGSAVIDANNVSI
jgi:hypothetical protein